MSVRRRIAGSCCTARWVLRVCGMAWEAYDLTKFAKVHPGGAKLITDAAGMDATAIFDPIHPKESLRCKLKSHSRDCAEEVRPMGTWFAESLK